MFYIRDYDYKSSWRPAGIIGRGGVEVGGAKTAHVPRQSVQSQAEAVLESEERGA